MPRLTAALTITLDKPQTIAALLLGNSSSRRGWLHAQRRGNQFADLEQFRLRRDDHRDRRHARYQCPGRFGRQRPGDGRRVQGGYSPSAASSISGSHSLTMNGNGTLLVSGQNSYTGGTTRRRRRQPCRRGKRHVRAARRIGFHRLQWRHAAILIQQSARLFQSLQYRRQPGLQRRHQRPERDLVRRLERLRQQSLQGRQWHARLDLRR